MQRRSNISSFLSTPIAVALQSNRQKTRTPLARGHAGAKYQNKLTVLVYTHSTNIVRNGMRQTIVYGQTKILKLNLQNVYFSNEFLVATLLKRRALGMFINCDL